MKSKPGTGPRPGRIGGGAREVACPACGKPAVYAESNPSRPFCSPRCRLTDLGGWASEAYRSPSQPGQGEGSGGDEDPKG